MKRILYIIILFMLAQTAQLKAAPQDISSIEARAAEAYAAGNYHYAIELYDSILQQGYASAALYYNMGNAFFKTNQLPYAILYYEKAYKADPSDPEIIHNLNLANTLITDKIEALPLLFYKQWWQDIYTALSADTWAVVSLVFIFLFFATLAMYLVAGRLLLKKSSFYLFVIFFAASVLTFIFARQQHDRTFHENAAIVFSPRVTAKSSPDEKSIDMFVIHEGTKVFIKDEVGEWYEIHLANGNVGWIRKSAVKTI